MSINNRALLDGIKLDSIKGILIDIDDTMYSYEPNHLNGLSACYKEISKNDNVSLDFDKFKDIYRDSRNKITVSLSPLSACRSRALAFELLFSKLGFKNAYVHAINYEKIYWDKFLENIKPHQYILDFLKRCKKKNKLISAVTDMQYFFQVMKLRKMDVVNLIDFLISSEEAGKEKPHTDIFDLALYKMKLKPNDVIMIGDSYEKDIIGANNAGIESIHLQV